MERDSSNYPIAKLSDHPHHKTLKPLPSYKLPLELWGLFGLIPLLLNQARFNRFQATRSFGYKTIIVLPGIGCNDWVTYFMRRQFAKAGYDVYGWGMGINRGNLKVTIPRMITKIKRLVDARGEPLLLVGWSLGGVMAREIARQHPELVSMVITTGAPAVGGPKYTTVGKYFRLFGGDINAIEAEMMALYARPIERPIIAFYTKKDHVVNWQACIDPYSPDVKHIEIGTTHFGMGYSPQLFELMLTELASAQTAPII